LPAYRSIIVGIGANLPTAAGDLPQVTCARALEALRQLPQLQLVGASAWFQTSPIPVSDQPDYINGAVLLAGETTPEALLAQLQAIERAFGRQRSIANAARTLDLDIVAMDGLVRPGPDPIIPHPRAHERAFVLRPIADILPGWRHPVLNQDVAALLDRLGGAAHEPIRLGDDGCYTSTGTDT
jgi:2-amino-4-hydroxy-6-hydroxymethyldihydropteridine diphosphokinase